MHTRRGALLAVCGTYLKWSVNNRRMMSKRTYVQACPMCVAAYTVGPHWYQFTSPGVASTSGSFCLVKLLRTKMPVGVPVGSTQLVPVLVWASACAVQTARTFEGREGRRCHRHAGSSGSGSRSRKDATEVRGAILGPRTTEAVC